MKKIFYICAMVVAMSSCTLFQLDNYDAPAETLYGSVVDKKTGEPVLTDQGTEGIRVRLIETSWEGNVTPLDFYCRPDGSFQNTKLFEADYNVCVDGPFVPLVLETEGGTVVKNETANIHLKGKKELKFEVSPFLKVRIDGSPMVSGGKVTAKVVVERATTRAELASVMEPTGIWEDYMANVTDIQLFVSYSSTVGYRNRDNRWSSEIKYSGSSFDAMEGHPVSIKSNGTIPSGRKVFIRAAARINFDTPMGSGTRRWNYSEPVEIDVP